MAPISSCWRNNLSENGNFILGIIWLGRRMDAFGSSSCRQAQVKKLGEEELTIEKKCDMILLAVQVINGSPHKTLD